MDNKAGFSHDLEAFSPDNNIESDIALLAEEFLEKGGMLPKQERVPKESVAAMRERV